MGVAAQAAARPRRPPPEGGRASAASGAAAAAPNAGWSPGGAAPPDARPNRVVRCLGGSMGWECVCVRECVCPHTQGELGDV